VRCCTCGREDFRSGSHTSRRMTLYPNPAVSHAALQTTSYIIPCTPGRRKARIVRRSLDPGVNPRGAVRAPPRKSAYLALGLMELYL
jgi:hypothetical protein